MRCFPKLVILSLFFILLPLLLVQTSRKVVYPTAEVVQTYAYTYDELYAFVYDSMSEMVRLEDEARDIFAKNFATTYQGQELSFEDMMRSYIDRRTLLLPLHDLIFKLGLITDYYQNPYMTLLFNDPEAFAIWVDSNAPQYKDIFALYAMKLQFADIKESVRAEAALTQKIVKANLSPDQLVEIGKITLKDEDDGIFIKLMGKLAEVNSDEFSNAGFENDSWVLLASYYNLINEKELSLGYATELLDVFEGNDLYFPFTRHVDSYSDVMKFLSGITENKNIYFKIVNKILDNDKFAEIKDVRLLSQIYLNLASAPVQHLNPDYAYNLALELVYLTEGNETLNNNYFLQVNKFNILNILASQGDFYNMALSLEELGFANILNNKYPNYHFLSIYKLMAYGNSYEYGAQYDQALVDNINEILPKMYVPGTSSYVQIKQLLIAYLVKNDQLDQAFDEWNAFESVILGSEYLVNNQKLSLLLSNYQLFQNYQSSENSPDIKAVIMSYAKTHYISARELKRYVKFIAKD
ncbi:MAG: hypothetical protein HON23_03010 [Rickettsiales bacterium]|jgi:hypothetical protein|nr:hypothetical protein [Rickettsiales bacterium]